MYFKTLYLYKFQVKSVIYKYIMVLVMVEIKKQTLRICLIDTNSHQIHGNYTHAPTGPGYNPESVLNYKIFQKMGKCSMTKYFPVQLILPLIAFGEGKILKTAYFNDLVERATWYCNQKHNRKNKSHQHMGGQPISFPH